MATVHSNDDLVSLLRVASVVVICLPSTPATDNLLGASELSLLPRGAILVNVGRGAVVDEAALYATLRDGRLGGAGLDVSLIHVQAMAMTMPGVHAHARALCGMYGTCECTCACSVEPRHCCC